MKILFKIPYFTHWGQRILVSGNIAKLGNGDPGKAFPLVFQGHEDWIGEIEFTRDSDEPIRYKYILFDENTGKFKEEWGDDRTIIFGKKTENYYCIDRWNDAASVENVFMTSPFRKVLLKGNDHSVPAKSPRNPSHKFITKAPFLRPNQVLCVIGNCAPLGDWKLNKPQLMAQDGDTWVLDVDLHKVQNEIHYKYGIYDVFFISNRDLIGMLR